MDKIDFIIQQVGEIKTDVAVLSTKIADLPEIKTDVKNLCSRVGSIESAQKTLEKLNEKNIKKMGVGFTVVGITIAIYNTWRTMFG